MSQEFLKVNKPKLKEEKAERYRILKEGKKKDHLNFMN